ncbi:periplasmic heavy metal sensor [Methylomonas sp. MO1]|uniref:periplasmic heavy metal sensor n=1 Tax=unclassified Methylomonas TaxID=2608980 RepID=UPI001968315A|nr:MULTISPECIES: periplasmic heavy metal sensor [unclassified Methylomonas]MDT4289287.1 periplasmic heavy metal sensor [Methylomonas sp. MO1]QSB01099.1 periplasmic heavy metal sensor [Methylomonas sp. EFPC1]
MRKNLFLAIVLALPLTAFAYPSENDYGQPVDHKLEHLNKLLQLSPEQKTKLEAIFKEQHEKFRAIHEESHSRMKEVLSPEQMQKMDDLRKQHQEQMREQAPRKPAP